MQEDPPPSRRARWGPRRWLVLAASLALLAGAAVFAVTWSPSRSGTAVAGTEGAHSPADAAFLQDMIVHHRQAVEMSEIVLAKEDLPGDAGLFASEIARQQRLQIEGMENTLERWNLPTEPGATAMEWMGAPVPPAEMHGMASEAELDGLRAAEGAEATSLFYALMGRHHLGGAIMGEAIAARGTNPGVRAFGDRSARYQRVEIAEFGQARRRAGIEVAPGFTDPPTLPLGQGGDPTGPTSSAGDPGHSHP